MSSAAENVCLRKLTPSNPTPFLAGVTDATEPVNGVFPLHLSFSILQFDPPGQLLRMSWKWSSRKLLARRKWCLTSGKPPNTPGFITVYLTHAVSSENSTSHRAVSLDYRLSVYGTQGL